MGSTKVGIVGAGPGGITCAMILANNGFDVTIFEREKTVGGRNAALRVGEFKFDTGPTFLMMKFILDDVFQLAGRDSEKYLQFKRLEPMYHLSFGDVQFSPTTDRAKMRKELERAFPGNLEGLEKFYNREKKRYEKLAPCLQKDYVNFSAFLTRRFITAIPHLLTKGSIYETLGNYFKQNDLRICFTFQSKYLGMSPWECPGAFTMIPFVEHEFGIYHTIGGLNEISIAMANVFSEHGGKLRTGTEVKELLIEGRAVKGVKLKSGGEEHFDEVIINADFGHAMTHLVEKGKLRKYSEKNLKKKKYSCSTFMLYLGVDKLYDLPHHNVYFAKDYKSNIDDIAIRKVLSKDVSFYLQNASVTDKTLAPKGKSTIYVLVPVANNSSSIDWDKEKAQFRELVLNLIEKKTPLKDIRNHIEVEKILTPKDWEEQYNVFQGATFNLAHNLTQMLYFRPHNKFEELEQCWLVGGGTHPGSGLPTIYESGRITAELIMRKYGVAQALPRRIRE